MINLLRKVKRRLMSRPRRDISGPFNCPVCRTEEVGIDPLPISFLAEMQRHQFIHNIFYGETLNLEHYSCKKCGASDRDRLFALYLNKHFSEAKELSLLDIAPASALAKFIRSFGNVKYRSMDLMMEGVDDKLDITNMHLYAEGQFDFFICSHVLEHIPDDITAMKELYRILATGGKGIAMVPINTQLEQTMEDLNASVSDRWKYFGQDDHVRMYAKKDFISKLQSVGFEVKQFGVNFFGEETFKKAAITPNSILYIVTK